jgi:subtilisin family serine protease
MASGEMTYFEVFYPTDIASFSSYGPDENGVQRPDVCAPGAVVLSSANRYDMSSDRSSWPAPVVVDGTEYPYYPNKGTSMSAPAVTGAIALMLQANSGLTAADVREVLKRTSVKDEFVMQGNAAQWGAGKLDVWAAVNDVIHNGFLLGDVNNDGEVNIADVQSIIAIILGTPSDYATSHLIRADVDKNTEINIADINQVIKIILH